MVPRPAQWLLVLLLLASAVAAHRPWHPSSFWPWRQDPQQFVGTSLKVPKILHHVYMGGYKEYLAGTKRRPAVNVAAWRESCLIQHPDWTAMFWDEANAHRLLAEHYAWFLPTWARYGSTIARADAIRPFIMHRYGGLYLDLDVQCFRNGASFLTGYDVVLQASSGPWDKGTINCAMASVPEHPLWMVYAHLLPSKQQENDTLEATGPRVLAQAVAMHFDTKLPIKAGLHADADDTVVQVYPAGQWYLACMPPKDEPACSRLLIKALVTGELPLDRLAGHHRFHGTWYDAPHDDRLWEDLRATVLQSPRMGHQGAGQGLIQPAARPQPRSWRSWGLPKAGRSKTSRAQEANARRSNQVPFVAAAGNGNMKSSETATTRGAAANSMGSARGSQGGSQGPMETSGGGSGGGWGLGSGGSGGAHDWEVVQRAGEPWLVRKHSRPPRLPAHFIPDPVAGASEHQVFESA